MPVVKEYLKYSSIPVILKPNDGLPHDHNGTTVYDIEKEEFTILVCGAVAVGVLIVGGCCGTTPEYIKALSDKLNNVVPKKTEKKILTSSLIFFH